MSRACLTPLSTELLAAYWAGDLSASELEAADEHLMGCAACTQASSRLAEVSEALRRLLPPVVSAATLHALRERGLRVHENAMQPGERREVPFPAHIDVLVHALSGLELAQATRVDFVLRDEQTGRILVAAEGVPFERERCAVLVACQKHYAAFPADTVAELRVASAAGEQSATYTILHRYA